MDQKNSFIRGIDIIEGIIIIRIQGDFDVNSTPKMCQDIEMEAKQIQPTAVLLDFKDIDKVDSAAFACLVSLIMNRIQDPDKVGVFNMNAMHQSLFDILQVHKIINQFATEQDAIDFFKKQRL